ncbi:MAG: AsmA-like C-terminal region-containing protein [Pseudorhodoferax sp.]
MRKTLLALAVAVPAAAALAAWWWLPSEQELAARLAQEAGVALGVGVHVGALHWRLLPRPALELRDVATDQPRPLELRRVLLQPRLLPMLAGRVELHSLEIDGGTVVQRSLRELRRGAPRAPQEAAPAVALDRLAFRDLTWVSHSGVAVAYAGDLAFDAGLQLREARFWRPGLEPVAELRITRQAQDGVTQRFGLRARLAGGSADGQATLHTAADGQLRLQGELAPRGVEVQQALAAFNRNSPVGGKADGQTRLSATGENPLALAQSLHTATRFTVRPATLLRFDLQRAIDTLGREHQGQTRLDLLEGQVDTQNTPGQGMEIRFTGIRAQAGALTASGSARLHQRRLQAKAAVDVVDGVVGLPLTVQGRLGELQVQVSKAPAIGAAAGTVVLPGIGTAIGAAIGRLLGGDEDAPEPPPPASRR